MSQLLRIQWGSEGPSVLHGRRPDRGDCRSARLQIGREGPLWWGAPCPPIPPSDIEPPRRSPRP